MVEREAHPNLAFIFFFDFLIFSVTHKEKKNLDFNYVLSGKIQRYQMMRKLHPGRLFFSPPCTSDNIFFFFFFTSFYYYFLF